jgi:hypothetical protein
MSDTDTENRLILDESQRAGTVGLPHCELVISYQSRGKTQNAEDEPSGPRHGIREGTGSPLASDEVRRGLPAILSDIPGIHKKETRDVLLAGLPITLRESLEPRPATTKPDLIHIVAEVERRPQLRDWTWPIDTLIENAIELASDFKKLVEELNRHLDKRRRGRPSLAITPSPLDLEAV